MEVESVKMTLIESVWFSDAAVLWEWLLSIWIPDGGLCQYVLPLLGLVDGKVCAMRVCVRMIIHTGASWWSNVSTQAWMDGPSLLIGLCDNIEAFVRKIARSWDSCCVSDSSVFGPPDDPHYLGPPGSVVLPDHCKHCHVIHKHAAYVHISEVYLHYASLFVFNSRIKHELKAYDLGVKRY